jgi:hypothetical protein
MREKELNSKLPNWLKKTQNKSWEPEVFISGIVLFGLIQIPEKLENFRFFFKREIYGLTNNADNIIAVLMTSIQWLILGLILHLFVRGVWIGLVGLSYVFPKGVDHEKLNYHGDFENRVRAIPDFTKQIITLEKVSSSIFSISYFIFMSILGAYFFLLFAALIPMYALLAITGVGLGELNDYPNYFSAIKIYAFVILGIGGVYMIDFLSLGLLRKNRIIAKIYYPIYKIVSTLTLSVFYRNIYYLLISNFKKWKVVVFIITFIGLTFYLIGVNSNRASLSKQFTRIEMYGSSATYNLQSDAYANLKPDEKYQNASIQSDIIKDDVLKLFITHYSVFDDSVKTLCDYRVFDSSESTDSLKLVCMTEFYNVSVDDSLYTDINWLFHYNNQTKHRGIVSYLDISHLPKGMHSVDIELKNWSNKNYDVIQFYKE